MKRIQRKRTKGWKMPENTVYVGRPTKWGNPFSRAEPEVLVNDYESYIQGVDPYNSGHPSPINKTGEIKADLQGKNLACWCPLDKPCHADVLLEIANT